MTDQPKFSPTQYGNCKNLLAGRLDALGAVLPAPRPASDTERPQHNGDVLWQAWLMRISFDLDSDKRIASKQIGKVLFKGGIKIVRDEFNIFDRRGDKLRCVFLLDLGAPGAA
jgi:hypothetical protein